jgi:hypothetical protein
VTVEALSSFLFRLVPELAGEDLQASGSSPMTTAKRSVRLSAVSIGKPSKRVMPLALLKQHGCRLPDPVSHFSQNLFLPVTRYVQDGSWERQWKLPGA